ncbi:MAG: HAD family hydrolase [Verrucomicrobia bacterium]|nr:HAD family hydrolase [Verrucomicrobiota bacterium]
MLADIFTSLSTALEPIPTGLSPKLPKLDDIQTVIFDVYGTLVVSGTGDISIAQTIDREAELRSILEKCGHTPSGKPNLSKTFYSLIKEDHSAAKAKGAAYPEVDILEIWERFFDVTTTSVPDCDALKEIAIRFECAVNPVWPMPYLLDLLNGLKDRSMPTGIVSNAQFYTPVMVEGFTGQTLERLGFQDDLCVWSYVERLGKPSVELFQKLTTALAARDIASEQALYVGNDMLNDIWTASQAGLRTALFAGDQRSLRLRESDQRCKNLEPDVVLTALPQLWEVL